MTTAHVIVRTLYTVCTLSAIAVLFTWPRSYFYADIYVPEPPASSGDPYWYSYGGRVGREVIDFADYGTYSTGSFRSYREQTRWVPRLGLDYASPEEIECEVPYWCLLAAAATPWLVTFVWRSKSIRMPSRFRFGIQELLIVTALVAFALSLPTAGGTGWMVLIGEVLALLAFAAIAYMRPAAEAKQSAIARLEIFAYLWLALCLACLGWDFSRTPRYS